MAKMKIPDPLSRRHLLEGGLDSAKALALAKAYLEEGREVESIDFLSAAGIDSNSEVRDALKQLQSTAVEQYCVAFFGTRNRVLVHDAALHACILSLRPLTKHCKLRCLDFFTHNRKQCIRDTKLERRRRTQARAQRNIAVDQYVRAAQANAQCLELYRNTLDILDPANVFSVIDVVEVEST